MTNLPRSQKQVLGGNNCSLKRLLQCLQPGPSLARFSTTVLACISWIGSRIRSNCTIWAGRSGSMPTLWSACCRGHLPRPTSCSPGGGTWSKCSASYAQPLPVTWMTQQFSNPYESTACRTECQRGSSLRVLWWLGRNGTRRAGCSLASAR